MNRKQLIGTAMLAVPIAPIVLTLAPHALLTAVGIVAGIVYVCVALALVCND